MQATFDRVDADHDGFITQDEITAFREQMRQRFTGGGGGGGGAGGPPPGGGRGFGGGGLGLPMGPGMFEQADANHDGKLSVAEAAGVRAGLGASMPPMPTTTAPFSDDERRGDARRFEAPPPQN